MRSRIPLPIDSITPEVVTAVLEISDSPTRVLLIASPGSGKTTRIPWALAEKTMGKVYVLEPRRIAAKLSAVRVAEENGVELGGREAGYQFRFEKKRRDDTRLVFLTEGTLLRELEGNPTLRGIDVLVLDEFHERHLQADLALALTKRLQETSRPDLKLLLMSATLDPTPLERFLKGSKRIELIAPRFPLEVEYHPRERIGMTGLEKEVRRAAENLLARADAKTFGDVLVFLPGMAEIRRVETELRSAFGSRVEIFPLHGELTKEEQSRALAPSLKTKFILATNIAESSVTIPGVNSVIDTGFARIASHSHTSGLPRLETKSIAKASAIQRAGRAGRTGPGRVIRLYGKGEFEGRASQETPEILRTDLAPVLLDLSMLNVFPEFEFFESPSKERIEAGWKLLSDLGFTTKGHSCVDKGARLSFHPRITRSLLEIERLGLFGETRDRALLALLAISEGEDLGLDFMAGLNRFQLNGFQSRIFERLSGAVSEGTPRPEPRIDSGVERVILAGFHDRVGKKIVKGGDAELLLARGGSVALSKDDFWSQGELFLVLDLQESKRSGDARTRTFARSAILVEEEWLWEVEPLPVREATERVFDEKKKEWMEAESYLLHDLVLSKTVREAKKMGSGKEALSNQEWEKIFSSWLDQLRRGLGERDGKFSPRVSARTDAEAWASLGIRYQLLRKSHPGRDGFSEPDFQSLLYSLLFQNYRSVSSVRDFPDLDTLLEGFWNAEATKRFREETPSFISLPGRAKVPVHYEVGTPARIESRLQDFFGLRIGPTILRGGLKLSLHLQAPNYRAVQITEDLLGFWQRHYPSIRKELMRQYPRHRWPEDPLA